MFLIQAARFLLAISVFGFAVSADAAPKCQRPWIYFDLGQTLVDTDSHNFNPMFYMPGAVEYIESVIERGHQVGLIIDIPEEWGRDIPFVATIRDEATAKMARTVLFTRGSVREDGVAWRGEPFDWRPFGKFIGRGPGMKFVGRVFLPMSNLERKDTGNPIVFERAKIAAVKAGCPAIYMTEDNTQFPAARRAGLATFQVGQEHVESFFLPPERIDKYIEEQFRRPPATVIFKTPSPPSTRVQRPPRMRRFPL